MAMPLPAPREAPVTRAVVFLSEVMFSNSLCCCFPLSVGEGGPTGPGEGSFRPAHPLQSLRDTLSQPPPPRHEHAPELPSLLRDAKLEQIAITKSSPAAGKLIGELGLRTATGASIVGIERGGENIVNPGPDEELRAADRILLIGTRTQLDAAARLFGDAMNG